MSRSVRVALVFYVPMLVGGFVFRPPGMLRVADWTGFAEALGIACFASVGVIVLSRWVGRHTAWGGRMHGEFLAALGPLTSGDILWLSLLSAFGEEIVFRGVLQARIGLWWATLLFGALHFPFRGGLWPWTVFALAMGVGLGLLTAWSGSLWPAIFIHLCVNYFNLHDMIEGQQPPPKPVAGQ